MVLKIFKTIATFLTALDCTKFVFGLCSAQDPTGGAYSAYKRERGKGEKKGRGRGLEEPPPPFFADSWIRP